MSAAAFELLPDLPGKQESLQGKLIQLPPTELPHSRIARALFDLLRTALDRSRVYIEAGYQMSPETWLQPDISVTRPDQPVMRDYLQGSPMIAIEVASRDNTADEIVSKTAEYLLHGVAEVWIVYPRTHWMMVHKNTSIEKVVDAYTSDLIPAAVVKLTEILA